MKKYIGIKLINAKPMTRLAYNEFRKWELPSDENGEDEGFLVEYTDGGKANTKEYSGYVSWSPKEVFEKAYKETSGLTFGLALEAMKKGFRVARTGWNGKGMFIYLVLGCELEKTLLRGEAKEQLKDILMPEVKICSHIDMKAADNSIVVGWLASQTDMLAEDWAIL